MSNLSMSVQYKGLSLSQCVGDWQDAAEWRENSVGGGRLRVSIDQQLNLGKSLQQQLSQEYYYSSEGAHSGLPLLCNVWWYNMPYASTPHASP